jgi:MFS family permease
MVVPVRVLYAEKQGASLAIISVMASAYMVSNFMFQYPAGWLADRWGRKQMILISLFAQAALSLVYLFLTDPRLFIVLRFVEGIAAAAFMPSARALLSDNIPEEKRGEAFGIFGAFLNAGFLLGPAFGGLIAGWAYSAAFIGAVLFRLVAAILVIFLITSNMQQKRIVQKEAFAVSWRELFAPRLLGAYLLAFGDFLYVGFDTTLAPLWLTRLGASITWIGFSYVCWSLPGILLAPWTGKLADRKRRSTLILVFGLAQLPLYISYGLSNSFWLVCLLFVVHGAFWIFVQPAVDSHLANASSGQARARIQGIFFGAGLMGGFVGASCLGLLYSWDFRAPLFAIGLGYAFCVLIGGTVIRFYERTSKPAVISREAANLDIARTAELEQQV